MHCVFFVQEAASTPAGHVAHDQNYRNPGDPPITPLAGPGPSRSPTTASTPATDFNTRASGHTQHTGPSLVASAGSTAFSYPLGGSRSEPDFKTASAHDSGHENSRAQGYDVPQSANLPPGTVLALSIEFLFWNRWVYSVYFSGL